MYIVYIIKIITYIYIYKNKNKILKLKKRILCKIYYKKKRRRIKLVNDDL